MIPDKRNGSISCNVTTCISLKTEKINKRTPLNGSLHEPVETLQNQTINESSVEEKYLESEENVMTKTDYEDINNFSVLQNKEMPSETNDESNDGSESPNPQDIEKVVDNKFNNNNNNQPSIPHDELVNENDEEMDMTQFESIGKLQGNNVNHQPPVDDPKDVHRNKEPCQRLSCRGPICDKYKVKRKLEECDAANDFLLVEGPLYIRRSLMEGTGAENSKKSSQSTLNHPEDSDMGLENCKRCCLQQKNCAKDLLKACDSDVEAIVKAYQPTYERQGGKKNSWLENEPTEDSKFYMQLTHGEADGDDKYHYLMVDTTTSYSSNDYKEEQQPIKKPLPPIKSQVEHQDIELSPPANTTEASTTQVEEMHLFNLDLIETKEDIQVESEQNVAEEKKSDSLVEVDLKEEEGSLESEEKEVEITTEVKEESPEYDETEEVETEEVETEKVETEKVETETEPLEHSAIDLDIIQQSETPAEERRTSILWNRNVISKTNSMEDEQVEGGRERRVSAVSWRSVEPMPMAPHHEAPAPTDSLQRIAEDATMRSEKTRQSGRQTSVFQDIIREEKRKSISKKGMPVIPDKVLKKSIVNAKMPPIQVKKARCCGLIKPKIKRDKTAADNPDDLDSEQYNDLIDEETSNSDSNRSSINSYRRRSSSVDNPVSEKKKEINKYLNNV